MSPEDAAAAAAAREGGVPIRAFIYNKKEDDDNIVEKGGHDYREDEVRGLIQTIRGSFNDILERRRNIEGLEILYIHFGKFGDILTELFRLYELGFYNSTILLCGTLAERICYDLIDFMDITVDGTKLDAESKEHLYKLSFRELLNFLVAVDYTSEKDSNVLHQIYNIRNTYAHPAKGGNSESDSITTLNRMCRVLVSLFDINKFYELRQGRYFVKEEYKDRVLEAQ